MNEVENLSKLITEKQDMVKHLHELTYNDLLNLLTSLSDYIFQLEAFLIKGESVCNQIILRSMAADSRTSFAKADAIMKSSAHYLEHRRVQRMKQLVTRNFNIVRSYTIEPRSRSKAYC